MVAGCLTSCVLQIGDTLEEFLLSATDDAKLRQVLMSLAEATRTIAFKVRIVHRTKKLLLIPYASVKMRHTSTLTTAIFGLFVTFLYVTFVIYMGAGAHSVVWSGKLREQLWRRAAGSGPAGRQAAF